MVLSSVRRHLLADEDLSVSEKQYQCSVNRKLTNKNESREQSAYTHFQNTQVTGFELRDIVQKGFAFSYAYSGKRKAENFKCTDIIAVDVDGGRSLEDALNDPFIQSHALFIYTTFSHTDDVNRYRIVFGLERTIDYSEVVSYVSTALARQLTGDLKATDPARIFFGCNTGTFHYFGKMLSASIVDDLHIRGKEFLHQQAMSRRRGGTFSTTSATSTIDLAMEVETQSGARLGIGSVRKNTSIYCPFHLDRTPSAFIDISKYSGAPYLHCRVCGMTWWTKAKRKLFNFHDFEERVVAMYNARASAKKGTATDEVAFTDLGDIPHVRVVNSPKLEESELPRGLTFIKSPKGTGKTFSLPRMFEPFIRHTPSERLSHLDWFEENQDPGERPIDQSYDTGFSILLIGHRQALIREMCQRLRLHCYLDDESEYGVAESVLRDKQTRYGICLDSLRKIRRKDYDLIIIDESEQVLSHFFSDTMANRRQETFAFFQSLLRASPRVICLDADLSWITFNTVTKIAGARSLAETKRGSAVVARRDGKKPQAPRRGYSKPVHIFVNQYVEPAECIKHCETPFG